MAFYYLTNNRGIALTKEGKVFLSYARQVVEQMSLLESRYLQALPYKRHFQVSTQHYSFAVHAFVALLAETDDEEYDVTLRECKTAEIIEDVKQARSSVGILYQSDFNRSIISKFIRDNHLCFTPLFTVNPHIFISREHPLAEKKAIALKDLEPYPYLCFEQGDFNSFYFSEEILSTIERKKVIRVSDRASLFNLLIGLKGYTISTGIISTRLNGEDIIARPLNHGERIEVGYILREQESLSSMPRRYIELLREYVESAKAQKEKGKAV